MISIMLQNGYASNQSAVSLSLLPESIYLKIVEALPYSALELALAIFLLVASLPTSSFLSTQMNERGLGDNEVPFLFYQEWQSRDTRPQRNLRSSLMKLSLFNGTIENLHSFWNLYHAYSLIQNMSKHFSHFHIGTLRTSEDFGLSKIWDDIKNDI